MPFGVVSGVGRVMGALDEFGDRRRRRGSFENNCGASHCNQWGLCCVVVGERRALPKLLWGGLVYHCHSGCRNNTGHCAFFFCRYSLLINSFVHELTNDGELLYTVVCRLLL